MDAVFEKYAHDKSCRIQNFLYILISIDSVMWVITIVAYFYGGFEIPAVFWVRFSAWPFFGFINMHLPLCRLLFLFMETTVELLVVYLAITDEIEFPLVVFVFSVALIMHSYIANTSTEM